MYKPERNVRTCINSERANNNELANETHMNMTIEQCQVFNPEIDNMYCGSEASGDHALVLVLKLLEREHNYSSVFV